MTILFLSVLRVNWPLSSIFALSQEGVASVQSFEALLQWLPSQSRIQFGRPKGPDLGCNRICEACGYVRHEWNETSDGSIYHPLSNWQWVLISESTLGTNNVPAKTLKGLQTTTLNHWNAAWRTLIGSYGAGSEKREKKRRKPAQKISSR